ncbi:hypothetical protein [Shouchella clausii]|uniref:hypothetical protein n=1 Tax=Shouchella clausii TaxID=79880 RepID=UPI002148A363|nr:hypothetical protein [Shouchella clausii]MCR1286807.1 hypothetical protein [Shouchella clausii]
MRLFRPVQAPLLQQESDHSYQYAEYAPSFDLSAYVACYWTSSFQGGKARHQSYSSRWMRRFNCFDH